MNKLAHIIYLVALVFFTLYITNSFGCSGHNCMYAYVFFIGLWPIVLCIAALVLVCNSKYSSDTIRHYMIAIAIVLLNPGWITLMMFTNANHSNDFEYQYDIIYGIDQISSSRVQKTPYFDLKILDRSDSISGLFKETYRSSVWYHSGDATVYNSKNYLDKQILEQAVVTILPGVGSTGDLSDYLYDTYQMGSGDGCNLVAYDGFGIDWLPRGEQSQNSFGYEVTGYILSNMTTEEMMFVPRVDTICDVGAGSSSVYFIISPDGKFTLKVENYPNTNITIIY